MRERQVPGPVYMMASLARGVLVVTAALLLTSLAGLAIFAAPITLPLLLLTAMFSPERGWRIAAVVVGGLTALELGWALAWAVWKHGFGSFLVGAAVGFWVGAGLWRVRRVVSRSAVPAGSDAGF